MDLLSCVLPARSGDPFLDVHLSDAEAGSHLTLHLTSAIALLVHTFRIAVLLLVGCLSMGCQVIFVSLRHILFWPCPCRMCVTYVPTSSISSYVPSAIIRWKAPRLSAVRLFLDVLTNTPSTVGYLSSDRNSVRRCHKEQQEPQ